MFTCAVLIVHDYTDMIFERTVGSLLLLCGKLICYVGSIYPKSVKGGREQWVPFGHVIPLVLILIVLGGGVTGEATRVCYTELPAICV